MRSPLRAQTPIRIPGGVPSHCWSSPGGRSADLSIRPRSGALSALSDHRIAWCVGGLRSSWISFDERGSVKPLRRKRFRDFGVTTCDNLGRALGLTTCALTRCPAHRAGPEARGALPMALECPTTNPRHQYGSDGTGFYSGSNRHYRFGRPRKHSTGVRSVRGARATPPTAPVGDKAE